MSPRRAQPRSRTAPGASHSACVDAWLARGAKDLSPDRLLAAFERAFAALWGRTHVTLGSVTLTAIVERLLESSAERHPILAPLSVDASGLDAHDLRLRAAGLPREALALALRVLLIEYLTIVGNLTAEILTPALQAELSKQHPRASRRKAKP